MARPALALVLPGLPRPSRRVLGAAAGIVVVSALAYFAARTTPLFALREVAVQGAPASVTASIRAALASFEGTSLVALDGEALTRRLEALPTVRSVHYDRAFPHTLRVFVDPERPLAVVRGGRAWWLVSDRGRLIRRVQAEALARYPRIPPPVDEAVAPGGILSGDRVRLALRLLGRPEAKSLPLRVLVARVRDGRITLALRGGIELRLAEPSNLGVKLAVAARVLRSLSRSERAALGYIDVSVPPRAVAGVNSQVDG
jgi:cell division septal protein FtsQ